MFSNDLLISYEPGSGPSTLAIRQLSTTGFAGIFGTINLGLTKSYLQSYFPNVFSVSTAWAFASSVKLMFELLLK